MDSTGTEEQKDSTSTRTLELAIDSLRREIDTLRAIAKKPDKPWYRDGALLLAMLAFGFTLWSAHRQDVSDTQAELRSVLTEIASIPAKNAEARTKFGNLPEGPVISQGLMAQNQVLSRQAFELAVHLGRNLEVAERVAVASAVIGPYPTLAQALLSRAKVPSDDDDIIDSLAALRMLGHLQIASGQADQDDQSYQAAEEIFKSDRPMQVDRGFVVMSNAETEELWGADYLYMGDCARARTHLLDGQKMLNQPALQLQFGSQLKQDASNYEARCRTKLQ